MIDTTAFGNRIRTLRMERGLSQQQLADKMYVTRYTVMRWESGEHVPDITVLSRLAEFLEVETYELLDTMNGVDAPPVMIVVDDEMVILRGFVHILEDTLPNTEVYGFQSAEEALSFAKSNRIDVAFLDIELTGESGLSLGKELSIHNPRINIIFLTGHSEYAMDALEMHSSGYLMKPLTPQKIKNEIAHLRFPVKSLRSLSGEKHESETTA
ncbi:MAG: response regulator [Clostridia bacterium]|nr:response regulator [Clostridia bacterium]